MEGLLARDRRALHVVGRPRAQGARKATGQPRGWPGPDAATPLLQRLFRDFMDEIGPGDGGWDRHYRPMATDPLSIALGRLRGLVGVQIGELAAEFDLDVSEELSSIVPAQAGWFFERFGED